MGFILLMEEILPHWVDLGYESPLNTPIFLAEIRPIRTPGHNAQHVDPLQTAAYQTFSNERRSGSGERNMLF